jgi:hypothetical protein
LESSNLNYFEFKLDGKRYKTANPWDHTYYEDWVSVRFRPDDPSDLQTLFRNDLDFPDEVILNESYNGVGGIFIFNILGNDWKSTYSGSEVIFERTRHKFLNETDSLGNPIWLLQGEFEGEISNGSGTILKLKSGKVSFTYARD